MPLSSNTYSTCLTPDPWLRLVVQASGQLLVSATLVVILTLPLDAALRALGCAVCLAAGRFELGRLRRGYRLCRAIRVFPGGELEIQGPDGDWTPGTLLSGTIVLQTVGWLRFRTDAAGTFVDIVRGDARESQQWRRLQVIWRHIGAGR